MWHCGARFPVYKKARYKKRGKRETMWEAGRERGRGRRSGSHPLSDDSSFSPLSLLFLSSFSTSIVGQPTSLFNCHPLLLSPCSPPLEEQSPISFPLSLSPTKKISFSLFLSESSFFFLFSRRLVIENPLFVFSPCHLGECLHAAGNQDKLK